MFRFCTTSYVQLNLHKKFGGIKTVQVRFNSSIKQLSEAQVVHSVDNALIKKGWILNPKDTKRNVTKEFFIKSTKKKADFVLEDADNVKNDLGKGLNQAISYCSMLGSNIAFSTDGDYIRSVYIPTGEELKVDGNLLEEFPTLEELHILIAGNGTAWQFESGNEEDAKEILTKFFKESNELFRIHGLQSGKERFDFLANLVFLKFWSEREHSTKCLILISDDVTNKIEIYNDTIRKELREKYDHDFPELPDKFENLFKELLVKIKDIKFKKYDSDIVGNCFEYFIHTSSTDYKEFGEYYTPKRFVTACMRILKPTLLKTIYDPFCGTGGFLIEAFKALSKDIAGDERKMQILKRDTLYGSEITSNAQIAKMNMILRGDGHGKILQQDSLKNKVEKKYDYILTNIPFAQKTNYNYLYGLPNGDSKPADGSCVLHCLEATKQGGQMTMIVPIGFISNSSHYKLAKEKLFTKAKLEMVIYLPKNAFKPYTLTQTAILVLSDAHRKGRGEKNDFVWIYKWTNESRTSKVLRDLAKFDKEDEEAELRDIGFQKKYLDKNFKLKPITNNMQETEEVKCVSLRDLVTMGILGYGRGKNCKNRDQTEVGNFIFPIVSGGKKNFGYSDKPNFDEAKKKITIACSGTAGLVQYFEKPIFVGPHAMAIKDQEME
eukprot:Pgem_evm1s16891